ncbi:MAG: hypothetical protein FWG63_04430 [Defluviitaleaceae bacterium]|nr:hypothetical protein [Defluviitaleaceae bacterium]
MIKKTNNNEVLTKGEAQEKYAKLYFRYLLVEDHGVQHYEDKIIVMYTSDTEEEIYASPNHDEDGNRLSISEGSWAGNPTVMHVGGVYIV